MSENMYNCTVLIEYDVKGTSITDRDRVFSEGKHYSEVIAEDNDDAVMESCQSIYDTFREVFPDPKATLTFIGAYRRIVLSSTIDKFNKRIREISEGD